MDLEEVEILSYCITPPEQGNYFFENRPWFGSYLNFYVYKVEEGARDLTYRGAAFNHTAEMPTGERGTFHRGRQSLVDFTEPVGRFLSAFENNYNK